ncbi:MAG: hypothetical protein K0R83_1581 [Caulobacter sp.]|jgi:uncharacterized membrane-anchored protein|nr:hypothetical protein [Caulobacter sp.]
MTRLRPWLIVGAAVLLAGALVWLILSEHRARAEGTAVRFALEGVDPRSLLSGHYVDLQLRETRDGKFCDRLPQELGRDAWRWIAIRQEGGRGVVVAETASRGAALKLAPLAVQGQVGCWQGGENGSTVSLNIGIDRFHASQKEAQAIETALRGTTSEPPAAFALVSIGKDGRARLLGIEVEGRRIMLDWFSPAA